MSVANPICVICGIREICESLRSVATPNPRGYRPDGLCVIRVICETLFHETLLYKICEKSVYLRNLRETFLRQQGLCWRGRAAARPYKRGYPPKEGYPSKERYRSGRSIGLRNASFFHKNRHNRHAVAKCRQNSHETRQNEHPKATQPTKIQKDVKCI